MILCMYGYHDIVSNPSVLKISVKGDHCYYCSCEIILLLVYSVMQYLIRQTIDNYLWSDYAYAYCDRLWEKGPLCTETDNSV